MVNKSFRLAATLLVGTCFALAQETRAPAAQPPDSHVPQSHAPQPRTPETRTAAPASRAAIAEKIKQLSSADPAKIAAAAYWLGEQGNSASEAVPRLAAVLGDSRSVDAASYRKNVSGRGTVTSPGQEAAAALVKIGDPAIEALINVLKTNPSAVARQNAAWALGIIQDRHAISAITDILARSASFSELKDAEPASLQLVTMNYVPKATALEGKR